MKDFNLEHWAYDWFTARGASSDWASYLTLGVDVIILFIVSGIADFITKRVILAFVKSYVKRTKNTYDDVFLDKKVFDSLSHIVPALIIYNSIPWLFDDTGISILWLQKIITIYLIAVMGLVVYRFLKALEYLGLHSSKFDGKPVSSYIQVFTILNAVVVGVLILSQLVGKSPATILTAAGAATAVVILVFRDSILGLVASIQISSNDMVKLGDWVSMDKFGADGNVIEINLTTVKVKNWDKTITTVPTYAFISDSFKNWRGMENTGVRRIKRSINIDLNSVAFADQKQLEKFDNYQLIKDYIADKNKEIEEHNAKRGADKKEWINGRHMTNIGVFRAYILSYIQNHPNIDQKETVMVRQLQPTDTGIPLEIYAFSNITAWVSYEGIQSDIFDHIMASAKFFDLKLFQSPAGSDFQRLGEGNS